MRSQRYPTDQSESWSLIAPSLAGLAQQSAMSLSDDRSENVTGIVRAFSAWAQKIEGLDARQVLAGLGHLGTFLKAISDPEIDLELGSTDSGIPTSTVMVLSIEHSWNPRESVGDSFRSQVPATSTREHSISSENPLPPLHSLENDDDASELFKNVFSKTERKLLKDLGFLRSPGTLRITRGLTSQIAWRF